MNQQRTPIDETLTRLPVRGRNLTETTFGELLGSSTLLVFLRHLG